MYPEFTHSQKDKVPQLTPVVQVTVRFPNKTGRDSADSTVNGENSNPVSANGATGNNNPNNINNSINAALMFGVNTNGGIVEPLTDLLFWKRQLLWHLKMAKSGHGIGQVRSPVILLDVDDGVHNNV